MAESRQRTGAVNWTIGRFMKAPYLGTQSSKDGCLHAIVPAQHENLGFQAGDDRTM